MKPEEELAIADFKRSSSNHTPDEKTIKEIEQYRDLCHKLAEVIIISVPPSRARSETLTHLENVIMWGVKAHILKYKDAQNG
jgi:hypothetical protein